MDNDLENLLVQLFRQVEVNPTSIPDILLDAWEEGSLERQMLIGFRTMLECIEQSRQDQQEELERLNLAAEGTNGGFFSWDIPTDYVYYSPLWANLLGYKQDEIAPHLDTWRSRLHADDRERVLTSLHDFLDGRADSLSVEYRLQHKDGSYRWMIGRGALKRDNSGKPLRLAGFTADITKRKQAEEQLREKEEQYRSIFEASADGLVVMDLNDGHLVEINPAFCKMHGYSYEEFIAKPVSSYLCPSNHYLTEGERNAIKAGAQFDKQAVVKGKDGIPFHIEAHSSMFLYKGNPHILSVVRDVTEQLQAQQLLEQRVTERTHELSILLEISHKVSSTIQLQPLLGLVLEQLKTVVDYCCTTISTLEGETLVIVESRCPEAIAQKMQMVWPIKNIQTIWAQLCEHKPVIGSDLYEESVQAQEVRAWFGDALTTTCCSTPSWMAIPFAAKERTIGILLLFFDSPSYYTLRHATLATAIAQQITIAMENARLYGQAQEIAALEERQRLARELHDSVSQALYGISLGAHTARKQLDCDPAKATEPLDYVLLQAETALNEMRALIFELRPELLAKEGLVGALRQQCTVLRARYGITIVTRFEDEPEISLTAKQELYRLVQEALHNTMKHARASKVDLSMRWDGRGLTLEIRDDGIGFDTTQSFPGHLGLHSMHERVTRLGGILDIDSTPGQGTCIHVQLPQG